MPQPSVIVHEKLAHWSRQLRPRFQGFSIRWSETRSSSSLLRAVSGSSFPILVIGLDDRPARGLNDLDLALRGAGSALSLVIDPSDRAEVAAMGRELGATLVMSGVVVPPDVEAVLRRWLPLSVRRSEGSGWSPSAEPEPEPWERPELLAPRGETRHA